MLSLTLKKKLYYYVLKFALPLILIIFIGIGCSSSGNNDNNPADTTEEVAEDSPSLTSGSADIGIEGGVLKDSNGARIEIPPGALDDTQTITFTAFMSNSELPDSVAPIPCFRGALQLEPDGLTFSVPVTITVPVNTAMNPGEAFPLFYWNETTQMWDQTDFVATVADDGMSFSAEVTHFSTYGGGAVENLVSDGDADAFKNDFTDWFQKDNNATKIGDRKVKNNDCFKVVGFDFDLEYEINHVKNSRAWRVGESSNYFDAPLMMVDYKYDISDGQSFTGYVRITVTIYYKCCAPDFVLMSDRSVLLEGETTSVEADLACAGTPLTGKSITFSIASGPGEVNPGNTTTNSGGTATTTFTAGDDGSVVKAYYYTCELEEEQSETMERELPIATAPDAFIWQISFDQTTAYDDYHETYSYSGSVSIAITEDHGDGSADVAGNNTFKVTGSGEAGDCTWTIQGTVLYDFTGTLVTDDQGNQTLNLTQTPNFSTTKTIYCPDDTIGPNPYLTGGETSSFTIPVENGHTIERTISVPPIVSNMVYILTF
jgi:hypothetical protein